MKRLKRLVAKPRAKKKEVVVTMKISFEVFDDNEDNAKLDCKRFLHWLKYNFSEWDGSMLQYFTYAHNLTQENDEKYFLDMHIDKIVKDDSSTIEEINNFNLMLHPELGLGINTENNPTEDDVLEDGEEQEINEK